MDTSLAQDYDVEPPATLFVVNSGLQMGKANGRINEHRANEISK
jgi:hypothetical protein